MTVNKSLLKNKTQEKKIFVYHTACQRRSIDAKTISEYFNENNYEIVNTPKDADYIVFFTCAFINDVADRCIDTITKLQKYDAELIVAGCLPDIDKEKLKKVFDGKIIPTKDLNKVDEIFTNNNIKLPQIPEQHRLWRNFNPYGISLEPVKTFKRVLRKSKLIRKIYGYIKENVMRKHFSEHLPFSLWLIANENAYTIMISRGCIHNCSYCAIKRAIGPLKSKSIDQCIKEFKEGLDQGYPEFVLNADDVGVYGLDIKTNFSELLDALTKIEGNYSIKMGNTHPRWVVRYIDDLEKIFARKKIKSILISVQSGSPRILKLMKRNVQIDALVDAVARLKKASPNLEIVSHFIVGFPTETEEDFQKTLDIVKKIHFDRALVFKYSDVNNTEATKIEPKVPKSVINKRRKKVLKLIKTDSK